MSTKTASLIPLETPQTRKVRLRPGTLLTAGGWVTLLLLPPLAMLLIVANFAVDLPHWDEWELAPLVIKLHTGGLSWADFWTPHNEHRIFFPKLLLVGLAKLGGWSVIKEMYVCWLLELATLLLIWRMLRFTLPGRSWILALLISSGLIFSAGQVQIGGAAGGYQIVWFMLSLGAVGAIWFITRWVGRWYGLGLAIGAAVFATYSLAGGLAVWPVILTGLVIQRQKWGWRAIAVWLAAAVGFLGIYFYGLETSSLRLPYLLGHLFEFTSYVLAYLGAPFAIGSGITVAALFGLGGLSLLAVTAYEWWRTRAIGWGQLQPWILLVLFGILSAALTATGRIASEEGQAISSRYSTIAALFWVGLSGAVVGVFEPILNQSRGFRKRILGGVGLASLLAIAIGYFLAYQTGFSVIKHNSREFEFGRFAVYEYSGATSELLQTVNPDPVFVRESAWALDQYREGPLAVSKAEYFRQMQAQWQKRLAPADYTASSLALSAITMVEGDQSSLQRDNSRLSFSASGKRGVLLYGDLTDKPARTGLGWPWAETQALDLQAQKVWYMIIYWDTGKGLNENERNYLYGLPDSDNLLHFRTYPPPGTKGFWVYLHYRTSNPTPDSFQVTVYDSRGSGVGS